MRETPFSNCERDFILQAISQQKVSLMIIMNRVLNVTVILEKQSRSSVVDNFRLEKLIQPK